MSVAMDSNAAVINDMFGYLVKDSLKQFAGDTQASITVEWVFIFPLLIWTYAGCFAFFDAFRTKNVNLTAAYTISDLLSRNDGNAIDQDDIDGLQTVFDYLVASPNPTWVRVTSFVWNEDEDRHELHWSANAFSADGLPLPEFTQADLNEMKDRIPIMAHNECAFVVQTSATYRSPFSNMPFFETLSERLSFNNFIVSRARFASEIPFEGMGDCIVTT